MIRRSRDRSRPCSRVGDGSGARGLGGLLGREGKNDITSVVANLTFAIADDCGAHRVMLSNEIKKRPITAIGFAVALSLVGCGDNTTAMFLALETEHFRVYREIGSPPGCDALGGELEGFYESFAKYLEVKGPVGKKVTYKEYRHLALAFEACHNLTGSCYYPDSNTIISPIADNSHEIGHVFETQVGGPASGPSFFSEGVASILGDGISVNRGDRRVDSSLPVEDLVDNDAFENAVTTGYARGVVYATATGFVRYLIDTFGKEAFLAFYGSLDGLSRSADIKHRFVETYARGFDGVVEDWRLSVQPLVDDLFVATPGCDLPPVLGPGASDVVDPQCASARIRFDVPPSGRVDLLLANKGDVTAGPVVVLLSCDHGNVTPEGEIIVDHPTRVALDVPTGAYEAIVRRGPVGMSILTDVVTVDLDGACSPTRTPAPLHDDQDSEFILVRRWVNVENQVAFDVAIQASSGFPEITSQAGGQDTSPATVYSCPAGCPTVSLDQDCTRDDLIGQIMPGTTVGVAAPHPVLRSIVHAGDLLHLATGPRFLHDWAYSVRLSLTEVP